MDSFPPRPIWVWRDFLCVGQVPPQRCLSEAAAFYTSPQISEDNLLKIFASAWHSYTLKTEIKYRIAGIKNSCVFMPDWTYVQSGVFIVELDVLFQRRNLFFRIRARMHGSQVRS